MAKLMLSYTVKSRNPYCHFLQSLQSFRATDNMELSRNAILLICAFTFFFLNVVHLFLSLICVLHKHFFIYILTMLFPRPTHTSHWQDFSMLDGICTCLL